MIGITYFPSALPCCCTVSKLNLRDQFPVLHHKTYLLPVQYIYDRGHCGVWRCSLARARTAGGASGSRKMNPPDINTGELLFGIRRRAGPMPPPSYVLSISHVAWRDYVYIRGHAPVWKWPVLPSAPLTTARTAPSACQSMPASQGVPVPAASGACQ